MKLAERMLCESKCCEKVVRRADGQEFFRSSDPMARWELLYQKAKLEGPLLWDIYMDKILPKSAMNEEEILMAMHTEESLKALNPSELAKIALAYQLNPRQAKSKIIETILEIQNTPVED